jgi:hypothetical protein
MQGLVLVPLLKFCAAEVTKRLYPFSLIGDARL